LKKLFVGRRVTAAAAFVFVALGSNVASAQPVVQASAQAAVVAGQVDAAAHPLGTAQAVQAAAAAASAATGAAVASVAGSAVQATPAAAVSASIAPDVAKEAAWLYQNGWPLYALVDRYSAGAELNEQATCLATAVYFEARGETLEGQLAVARVVMNRAASGRYPPSWCATVKQPWQFSFVRNGQFPRIDTSSDAWRKAQAITRLAMANVVPSLSNDVLWYHANYVAPSWGRRLTRVQQIGAHIFYRI
jgi:spore germination cell wall hydrolase CwlJ-like protein